MKHLFLLAALCLLTNAAAAGVLGEGREEQEREIAMGDCQISLVGSQYVVRGRIDGRTFYNKRHETRQKAIASETLCEHKALFQVRGGRVVHRGMVLVGDGVEFVGRKAKSAGKKTLKVGSDAVAWVKKHQTEQPEWAPEAFNTGTGQ